MERPETGDDLSRQNRRVGFFSLVVQQAVTFGFAAVLLASGWRAWNGLAAPLVGLATGLAALVVVHLIYDRIFARHLSRIYGRKFLDEVGR